MTVRTILCAGVIRKVLPQGSMELFAKSGGIGAVVRGRVRRRADGRMPITGKVGERADGANLLRNE